MAQQCGEYGWRTTGTSAIAVQDCVVHRSRPSGYHHAVTPEDLAPFAEGHVAMRTKNWVERYMNGTCLFADGPL